MSNKAFVKVVQTIDRLSNTAAGNPQFRVYFTDGTNALTKKDASVVYDLQNPEYQAPNRINVYYERGQIASADPIDIPAGTQ